MGRPLQVDWQDSENDLRERYLEETDHQDRTRLQALWLTRKGRPMSEVAEIVGVCYESVRRWVDWYRSGGLEEVLSRRHGGSGGREPRLSEEDREKLVQKAERGELRIISDGVRWAREEAGTQYTYWGMRHVFERLDLKKKVPRQQSVGADPKQQEAWKKGS
jgi:transposase